MRHALAVLLIATPVAAAQTAPHGPGCALSTSECLQVARELAIGAELDAEDARTFGFGLSPYARALQLVHRSIERSRARIPHLPVAIGNEVARLQLCAAEDSAAARDGTANADPHCR